MKRHSVRTCAITALILLIGAVPAKSAAQENQANARAVASNKSPLREWTKKDSTEGFQASLIEYQMELEVVKLMLEDGSELDCPKSELSVRDQMFVKRHLNKLRRTAQRKAHAGANPRSQSAQLDDSLRAVEKSKFRNEGLNRDRAPRNPNDQSVRRLYGIDWHSGKDSAATDAKGRQGTADDRPIIWFRVLGDLEDGM